MGKNWWTERRRKYEAYINSEKWQAKRFAALKRADYECEQCAATAKLHVHHLTYERFGDELLEDLQVLCEPCHDEKHVKPKRKPKRVPSRRAKTNRKVSKKKAARWEQEKAELRQMRSTARSKKDKVIAENEQLRQVQAENKRKRAATRPK